MNPKVNEEIKAAEVFLIEDNGKTYGRVAIDQAMYLAYEKGVDLVEISGKANPPIVKLIDYGKFQYEQHKKISKQKSKQKSSELKEIRVTLKIEKHDFETKVKKAIKFLDNGDKVRITVIMKGRENIFPDKATKMVNTFADATGAVIEQKPIRMGNRITTIVNKSTVKNA